MADPLSQMATSNQQQLTVVLSLVATSNSKFCGRYSPRMRALPEKGYHCRCCWHSGYAVV